jgi:hypothetical protein
MRNRDLSRLLCALACVAVTAALVGGCAQPLFSPKKQRSQYDRYDRSRNQFAPQIVEDEFGREEPNLWGRLEPKG